MLDDLTPEKDGTPVIDMEDDVIRGALVSHQGEVTFPPPPPKTKAIGAAPAKKKPPEETPEERAARELAEIRRASKRTTWLLGVGGMALLLVGTVAPASFMQHFIVFVLACFVGFHVIWGVAHSLHTPLMALTNAISSIIIVGALLQVGSASGLVTVLAALAILMASLNIFGGFLVTRRHARDVPKELVDEYWPRDRCLRGSGDLLHPRARRAVQPGKGQAGHLVRHRRHGPWRLSPPSARPPSEASSSPR